VTAVFWGAVPAVVIGGLGTCLVVALWTWFFPELRKLQRLSGPAPESPERLQGRKPREGTS
jgi:hypothetical protein